MSKNIVIVILIALCVASVYYEYQQRANVKQLVSACEKEKENLIATAHQQQLKAEAFQDIAARAQHEADVQRAICEALLNSKSK